jgi:hypothetical protein
VCLCGNHDDWFLRTLRDSRRHTWLLATDAFTTIESYSVDAADVLREAISRAGAAAACFRALDSRRREPTADRPARPVSAAGAEEQVNA